MIFLYALAFSSQLVCLFICRKIGYSIDFLLFLINAQDQGYSNPIFSLHNACRLEGTKMLCFYSVGTSYFHLLIEDCIFSAKQANHYGRTCCCRAVKLHGKGSYRHGKGVAVRRRTTKIARQCLARQRRLCRAPRQNCTAKALPCAPIFVVCRDHLPCPPPLPCVAPLCRATFLSRSPHLSVVRHFFAVRRGSPVHTSLPCAPIHPLLCAAHQHARQRPCQAHQHATRKHRCAPRGPFAVCMNTEM
jgi:hypothetical protein